MSSEPKEVLRVNPQLEQARLEIRDLLAGHERNLEVAASSDPDIRQIVAAELLFAIGGSDVKRQDRARAAFIELGYLDETVRDLRDAKTARDRSLAARILGDFGSRLGTTPLIAALFDSESEVREAATEALSQIGDPAVVIGSPESLRNQYKDETSESSVTTHILTPAPQLMIELQASPSNPVVETQDSSEPAELDRLLNEEHSLRTAAHELALQVERVEIKRAELDKQVQVIARRESGFRREVVRLREQHSELGRQIEVANAEAESARQEKELADLESKRLLDEANRLQVEAQNLSQAASERAKERARIGAARLAQAEIARLKAQEIYNEELERLRSEGEALALASEEAVLRRVDIERARRATEEEVQQFLEERKRLMSESAARVAENERLRREEEERTQAEQEQLALQVETLRRTAEEVAALRKEITIANQQAEAEAEALASAQARVQAAEETRRKAEFERLQLEAQLEQRVEEERRLLAEATARFEAEQRRVEEEAESQAAAEEQRLSELEELRKRQAIQAQERIETEQEILREIKRLEDSEIEARSRIEQAELRRRAAEETRRQAEEKAVKVEAEAHNRKLEEEQALGKLEKTKVSMAAEVQTRADLVQRIREEIAQLQRLEEDERRRIEEETLRRVQAEKRLQQEKEKLKAEETARAKVEVQHIRLVEPLQTGNYESQPEWRDEPAENLRLVKPTIATETEQTPPADSSPQQLNDALAISDIISLHSNDPVTRAKSLLELAKTQAADAFNTIANSFEDESPEVRNAAALALMQIEPKRPVEWFTKAFEEGSEQRRRNIGRALAESGLASQAVNRLSGGTREDTYNSLCLLFLMAKTGEVETLAQAIEEHKDLEVRRAAIRLLTLSGQADIADAAVKRRLNSFPA